MKFLKIVSTATASRDLKWGLEKGLLTKKGNKRLTQYQFIITADFLQ